MTLTPLLMHGQNKLVELRPASFRGVLRYWTRVLLGREVGDNLEQLQKLESQIWGDTGLGSSLTIQIGQQQNMVPKDRQKVLPARLNFDGYIPDRRFELLLLAHPLAVSLPKIALGGLLLALRLGGFGARSRRGGGSLAVLEAATNVDDERLVTIAKLMERKAPDGAKLLQYLEREIQVSLTSVGVTGSFRNTIPAYPVFTPEHAKVLVGEQGHANYEDALAIMWGLRSQNPFHDLAIFGDVRPRRASPVHMHIIRTLNNTTPYHPVMTIFRSWPNQPNDWSTMQDFVDTCAKNGFVEIFGGGMRW